MNMKYHVLDLFYFYKVAEAEMFLIISKDFKRARVSKKIRVSPWRFIELNYSENENVRIIIKREGEWEFDIYDVICRKGIYDLRRTLEELHIYVENNDYPYWYRTKRKHKDYFDKIIISENAMLISRNTYIKQRKLIVPKPIKIEGINAHFKSIDIWGKIFTFDMELINKFLNGETVAIDDFLKVVDRNSIISSACVEFDTLFLSVQNEDVIIKKFVNKDETEYVCSLFSVRRVEFVSMFLVYILKAEAENRFLSCIEKYYV